MPRFGTILHRYLFVELLGPFLLGLAVFTFLLLLARLLKLVELMVSRGLPAGQIVELLAYLLPQFLEITLPMAMLLAILVAFGRLSADAELVALRSSGVGLYQLLPPVAIFVVLIGLLTLLLSIEGRPWGNRALRRLLWDIARTHATAGLRPQVFNSEFPGLVIYAEQIDSREHRLSRVVIADERDPHERHTVFAREGWMLADPARQVLTLRLAAGRIVSRESAGGATYQTDFEVYDVTLDLREAVAGLRDDRAPPSEMRLAALHSTLANRGLSEAARNTARVEWHRRFAIPAACLVFGLVAVPLGIAPSRAVTSRGFAISLAVIFAYYVLLSVGQALAEQGTVPAAAGMWFPNLLLGGIGLLLVHGAARERPWPGARAAALLGPLRPRAPRRPPTPPVA